MDKSMKKKDNRGMSLVEIILVIALMTIVASAAGYGLNLISKKPVQECAKKVEIVLNQNRTNSMGKKVAYLEFYMVGNRVAVKEYSQSARESDVQPGTGAIIGAADVKLHFFYKDAAGNVTEEKILQDGASFSVIVEFKRDSGSLKAESDGSVLDRIEIEKGYVKTVSIDKLTGKVTLE